MAKVIDESVEWINNQELQAIQINEKIIDDLECDSLFTKFAYLILNIFTIVCIFSTHCTILAALIALSILFIGFLYQDINYTLLISKHRKHYNSIIRGKMSMDEIWKFVPSNYDVTLLDCLFTFKMMFYPIVYITTVILILF